MPTIIVQWVKGSYVCTMPAKVARDLKIHKGSKLNIETDIYEHERAEIRVLE